MASTWECTNVQYHEDTQRIGASMLITALRSPAEYNDLYVTRVRRLEQTPRLLLGSLVHCLVLEPELYDTIYTCRPEGIDGRTTDGKKALAAWRASSLGKVEITSDTLTKARRIASAVLESPVVQMWTTGSVRERAIVWEGDGLTFKCRPDWFIERPGDPVDLHLDLKTSDDPYPEHWLSNSNWGPIAKYRYDLQVAAHYPIGIEHLTGKPCNSGVVVVGTAEPHDVFVYDTTLLRPRGEHFRSLAIAQIKACQESGVWQRPEQSVEANCGVVVVPAPPEWTFN